MGVSCLFGAVPAADRRTRPGLADAALSIALKTARAWLRHACPTSGSIAPLTLQADQIPLIEAGEPALILFGHAAPFREPVVSHGPFVMNTRAEIAEAIADYQAGQFGG